MTTNKYGWKHTSGKYTTDYFGFKVTVKKEDGYGWKVKDTYNNMVGGKFFKTAHEGMSFAQKYYE